MIVIRRGAGPLHIGREYRGRFITRCGNTYTPEDVTEFRSRKAVEGVWKNWDRKCVKCCNGLPGMTA